MSEVLELIEFQNKAKKKAKKKKNNVFNKYDFDWDEFQHEYENWYIDDSGQKVFYNQENGKILLNRTHLMVGDSEPVILDVKFWKARDIVLPRVEAFLKGAHLYDWINYTPEFWANSSNCFHSATNFTWITFPMWLKFIVADNPDLWAKWQVTTEAL